LVTLLNTGGDEQNPYPATAIAAAALR